MTPAILELLIPIVAIITTFTFPVALVATFKWFKLKERELQIDAELRKTSGTTCPPTRPADGWFARRLRARPSSAQNGR